MVGWVLSVYPGAGEAGGSFRAGERRPYARTHGAAANPERAAAEAARRARAKLRRYCAANRLNRLGTLTYRGDGCHDPVAVRKDAASFFRHLRDGLSGKAFPYVWTAEWHKGGHGLHLHFAVGRFVRKSLIDAAWGHGFTHIKLLSDLAAGSGPLEEARQAAGYLAKYVGKAFDEERVPGLHRYEVAQTFQPEVVQVHGRSIEEATDAACRLHQGRRPSQVWSSSEVSGWEGPPAVWLQWPG